jgi:hypothetical protein
MEGPSARPCECAAPAHWDRRAAPLHPPREPVLGFRSASRDWAADHGAEFAVAEQCLAHAVGNSVTRAVDFH